MKKFTFTQEEAMIIRDALTEYKHFVKDNIKDSPRKMERLAKIVALKDQFVREASK